MLSCSIAYGKKTLDDNTSLIGATKAQYSQSKASEEERQRTKKRKNYNTRHKTSEQAILEPGYSVWITDQQENGEVQDMVGPRSYTVDTPSGTIRRNRRHLNLLLPIQDENNHPSEEETSSSFDTPDSSERPRRSSRPSKPPDSYGDWVRSGCQN